jgi:erythronate-4-phosphate dehydrogenase
MKIVADGNIPFVKECFSSIGEVEIVAGREIKPGVVADADVLLVRSVTPVGLELLAGSKVRFVGTATIGFEHVDVDFLKCHHIGFASAPGSNANSVAEYILAALLEAGEKYKIRLEGKSIGIIGMGNVGSRVAVKAAALGMKTLLNDPPLQRETGDTKYLPIEELFGCDFVTVHTPLTFEGIDKTFHLADERFFGSLKKGCVFLNTARGGVVDTNALKAAMKKGIVKAAVLDVWEDEPNIDTELLEMADIGTPHIAGYSFDGKVGGMIMIYKAVCEHFEIEPRFDAASFLPEPEVPELEINAGRKRDEELIRDAVRKIYDIRDDDKRMREILRLPEKERGEMFDGLRKEYPVRREFQNTQIKIADSKKIAEKLRGIGFLLSQE